jgi:transmembrane protein EpsG
MITTIFIGVIAILFGYLTRYNQFRWGLKASFILIFIFLALRYNFGNDYNNYWDFFRNIKYTSILSFYEINNSRLEIGWIVLNKLFAPFGYFLMIAFIAAINCIIYYRFINKYVPTKYFGFAVFIYVFNPNMMLVQVSAIRQSIAIMLFVFAFDFIMRRKLLYYMLVIFLASFFHTSALILLPVYFLVKLRWKVGFESIISAVLLFLTIILVSNYIAKQIVLFTEAYFNQYSNYLDQSQVSFGFMIIFSIFLLIIFLRYINFNDINNHALFIIAIIYLFLIPVTAIFPMIGRLNYYFQMSTIAVFPLILHNSRNKTFKLLFITIVVAETLLMVFIFFNSPTYFKYYETYQTIFSHYK